MRVETPMMSDEASDQRRNFPKPIA